MALHNMEKVYAQSSDYESIAVESKRLERLIKANKRTEIAQIISKVSDIELANILLTIDPDLLDELTVLVEDKLSVHTLERLNPEKISIVFQTIGAKKFCAIMNQFSDNAFYDLIHHNESITEEDEFELFLDDAKKIILKELRSYPERSAARLMQKELTYVELNWSVKQIRDYLRFETNFLGQLNRIFVIDSEKKIVGSISLARLIKTQSETVIKDVMSRKITVLRFDTDQRRIMQLFQRYSLSYALVCDKDNAIIGAINLDEIIDLTEDEAEREKFHLQFVGHAEETQESSFLASLTARLPWLLVNIVFSMLVSAFVGRFSDVISEHIELAILIPVIASISNIAGSQAIGTTIHSFARKDIRLGNIFQTFSREIFVTISASLLMSLVSGVVVLLRFGQKTAMLYCISMSISFTFAGCVGIFIPVLAHFVKLNPALISPILVNTSSDFFSYLVALMLAVLFF